MTDTEKPFLCNQPGCGMSFTNEDHLTVHKKKHDISLSLSGKHAYIDQTPTPTRFIRYGEEVGLFQDLQNVNPFEEQFKKATDAVKMGEAPLQPEPMSGPVDDALHTPQVISINRSRTPIVNTEPETHGEIDIEMLPHPPDPLALPDELKKLPPSSEITANCQIDKSKKFLPVIQLPNGQYISLTGEPVQPSIPSVIIPSTFVDTGSVTIEKMPVGNQVVQHKMVPPEPVAGSSKYYILPKPGIPPVPTKLSFTKEKLKEKVNKNKIVQPVISITSLPSNNKPLKRLKVEKSQNLEGNKDCKDEMKLERNRAAAARFRKKKKYMETNLVLRVRDLEEKVKELQSENKRVTNQMLYYRAESVKTKDLLLAHKDCSVTREMNKTEVIAVVDSSTHLTVTRRQINKSPKSKASQAPITVRRASVSKASSLTPLVIVRQSSGDGNSVLRYGGSSDSVIVENIQRPFTD